MIALGMIGLGIESREREMERREVLRDERDGEGEFEVLIR